MCARMNKGYCDPYGTMYILGPWGVISRPGVGLRMLVGVDTANIHMENVHSRGGRRTESEAARV